MLVVFAQGRTRNLEQRTLWESNHGRSCVQIKIRCAATTRPFDTDTVFAFINNICLDAQIRTFSCIFVYLVGRSRSGFCVLVVENVITRLTGVDRSYRLLSTTTATAERLPQPDSVPQQQQGTPARTSAPYTTREEFPARTDGKGESRRKRRAGTPGPRSRADRARRRAKAAWLLIKRAARSSS